MGLAFNSSRGVMAEESSSKKDLGLLQTMASLTAILEPDFPSDVGCFRFDAFFYFLKRELAVAERYGLFAGVLLFRVSDPKLNGGHRSLLASCLRSNIRSTDYLGRVDDDTIAVILQHATVENSQKVLQRLHREACHWLGGEPDAVSAGAAVFPTEANTLESLTLLAENRLTGARAQFE